MSKYTIGTMTEYVNSNLAYNTFCGLDAADIYHGRRLNNSLWRNADVDTRTSALFYATDILNRQDWIGNPVSYTQSLNWPRNYVPNRLSANRKWNKTGIFDDYDAIYSVQYLTSTAIPQEIQDATASLALYLIERADDGKGGSDSSSDQLANLTLGSLSMQFREDDTYISDIPNNVYFEIKDFLNSISEGDPSILGAGSVRLRRS